MTKLIEITDGLVIQNNTELTSLAGLENLTSLASFLRIVNNAKLKNYCSLISLFQANGVVIDTAEIIDNLYNPTVADLQAGTCTEN